MIFSFFDKSNISRGSCSLYGAIIHGIKEWTDFIVFVLHKCVCVSVSVLWWSANKFSISINGMCSELRNIRKKSEFMAQNNQRQMLPIHLLILRHLVDFKSCILYLISHTIYVLRVHGRGNWIVLFLLFALHSDTHFHISKQILIPNRNKSEIYVYY